MPPLTASAAIGAPMREALVVLGAAAIVIPLLHRLRLSPVIGYMLVGLIAGPSGLGALAHYWPPLGLVTIADRARIEPVAELGVVLLMFAIGLEMSWERIVSLRRLVFGLGALQVLLCTLALAASLVLYGTRPGPAIVAGLALAMSSTATVTQVLADERRMTSLAGRASFAVLLFQDLAVVPILFLLGTLGGQAGGIAPLLGAIAEAILAVVLLAAIGRLVLRPLFRSVARPDLLIVARARDAKHAAHLYGVGATDAVPETIEASLQLSEAVLIDLGVPMGPVLVSVHEQRARFQADIRRMAPDAATVRDRPRARLRDTPPQKAPSKAPAVD